jgi:membrane associated rhomboid family serine protease/Flp pilus assembly protein TadD
MANCVQCGRKLPPLVFGKKMCEWCVRHQAAQRGEEPEDAIQPVMPVPWAGAGGSSTMMVTQALLGLNIAVFVAQAMLGDAAHATGVQAGANYGPLTLGGEPWRLVTSMFLHGGLMHIFFNMWCLWDLGGLCESLYGHATFAAVYMISGVAASLASVWWHPATPSVGASGAIFGIVGALIASYYLGEFSMPRFAVAGHLRSVLIFAGYALIFGTMSGRTDNAAHLGGLVAGLAFGAVIARFAPERDLFRRPLAILVVTLVVSGSGAWLYQSRSYLIRTTRGSQLLYENETDEAVVELQAAIRSRPDYVPAHFALADAYFDQKKYDLAEGELKRVLALQPRHESARYTLGMVYLNQQRIPQAQDTFTELVRSDDDDGYAHLGLGMALAAEQNHPAAVAEYKRAAQLEPDLAWVYYQLGLSQMKLKNYDDAIAAFLKQQEARGDDAGTEAALAEAYRAKGMETQADAAMQKAQQLSPAK